MLKALNEYRRDTIRVEETLSPLKKSSLVKKLFVKETIGLPGYEKLIAIAYLDDGSILHIRERYSCRELIKYAYHLMTCEEIMRWDNVSYHKGRLAHILITGPRSIRFLRPMEWISRVLRETEQAQNF